MELNRINVYYAEIHPIWDVSRYLERHLSHDEVERANRYRCDRNRFRYIIGRGILRSILGKHLERSPSEIVFRYGDFGKPFIAGEQGSGLRFNISHSDVLLAVAISTTCDVGIDIEPIANRSDYCNLVSHFFCPEEIHAFQQLPTQKRSLAFLNAWTRKEAYLKAVGIGLHKDLNQVCVSLSPEAPAQFLDRRIGHEWSLLALTPPMDHVGALVGRGEIGTVNTIVLDVP